MLFLLRMESHVLVTVLALYDYGKTVPMWVLCCMFCVKLLLKVSLNFQQIQLVLIFHVLGQSLKVHIVIQNLLNT